MKAIKLNLFDINIIDIIVLSLTLFSVTLDLFIGAIPISVISQLVLSIYLLSSKIKSFNKKIFFPLTLLAIWIGLISLFQGDEVILNLIRLWSLILIAIYIPNFANNSNLILNSIKKALIFHSLILIIDYFFNVPWTWEKDYFIFSFNADNFERARGLFAEPNHFGILINSLYLILSYARKMTRIDTTIVLVASVLSVSVSSIVLSLIIFINYNFSDFTNEIYLIFIKTKIKLFTLFSLIIFLIFIPVSLINFSGYQAIGRITNPFDDSSIISRTYGSFLYMNSVMRKSPIVGFGLGKESTRSSISNFKDSNTQIRVFGKGTRGVLVDVTSHNVFVGIASIGGFVALTLYLIYFLNAINFNLKLFFLISILLSSSGLIWEPFLFAIPSIFNILLYYKD